MGRHWARCWEFNGDKTKLVLREFMVKWQRQLCTDNFTQLSLLGYFSNMFCGILVVSLGHLALCEIAVVRKCPC